MLLAVVRARFAAIALSSIIAPRVTVAQDAAALVQRAVAHVGGDSALRAVRTARLEYTTSWYRTSFVDAPAPPSLGIEQNVDTRDYTRGIWRYERLFGGPNRIVDVVRDSVAIMDAGRGWQPLSGAYVTERDELFTLSPERLLVLAADGAASGKLRVAGDTTIEGRPHVRVSGAIAGRPSTLYLRRGDAQLSGYRYRAGQPWDFGLAAWGDMEVNVWYGRWGIVGGVLTPHDVAINRVGRPYKRIAVTRAQYNVPIAEDSVAVSDSLRGRYLREQHRAMFDLSVDSIRTSPEGFTTFGVSGTPLGATRRKDGWLVYGAGVAPLLTERALVKLTQSGEPVAGVVLGAMSVGVTGGVGALAQRKVPMYAAGTARPYLSAMFAQQRAPMTSVRWVTTGGWHMVGGDSLWIEPADLPDAEGALVVWDPRMKSVYAGDGLSPAQARVVIALAGERRWAVAGVYFRGALTPLAQLRRQAGLAP